MKRIWVLGASIVILALGVATTATAKTSTSCGTLRHTGGGPAQILASGVSCTTARQVIKDFSRLGPFHNFVGTNHTDGYSVVDGSWHCTLFMGHSACTRGDATIKAEPLVH